MNHYVYEITNNINGMKYIGKRSCHCEIEKDNYMGGGTVLKKAQKEFGLKNFSKKILAIADNDDMVLDLESYYIEKRNAVESDAYYNQVYGGDISHMFKHNDGDKQELVRKRISEKNKGTNAGENSKVAKKVICLNTKEVYVSCAEAGLKNGLSRSAVSRACRSKFLVGNAGKNKETGAKLKWMYYEEYLKKVKDGTIDEVIYKSKLNDNTKQVICLNTGEVFDSIVEASIKYNASSISTACYAGTTSGTHPVTGEKLKWMHYSDYIKTKKE